MIRFPDGEVYEVAETVTQETPEQKAARLEQEEREREQARARQARYEKTPAGKLAQKAYDKTPAGKAIRDRHEKARQDRVNERKLTTPFWGIDTEGVSMHELAWTENEGKSDQATYVPQKITVLTAGGDDDVRMLCHAEKGLG